MTQHEAIEILRENRVDFSPEDPRSLIEVATILQQAGNIAIEGSNKVPQEIQ